MKQNIKIFYVNEIENITHQHLLDMVKIVHRDKIFNTMPKLELKPLLL